MRRLVPIALLVVALVAVPAPACLNDRDTSGQTVARLPAVVDVITGRFARNIPLYHEMRLDRVASEIGSNPDALDLYDDAAVAADRLGRYDEAIDWMERKRARLEALPGQGADQKEAWYRYHANVGTHWVHRWIKQGADRARLDEVRTARDYIAEAIAIKPNAHFGRERFQLQAIDWIIAGPGLVTETYPSGTKQRLPLYIDETWTEATPREAVEGLCGLIVLGNAWESVDTFLALAAALEKLGEPGLAFMARLRCEELIDAGRGSLVPGSPKGKELKAMLGSSGIRYVDRDSNTAKGLQEQFRSGRAAAESLQENRAALLRERLEAGRHPDTDPTFWDGAPAELVTLDAEDQPRTTPVIAAGYAPPTEDELDQYDRRSVVRGLRIVSVVIAVFVLLLRLLVGLATWLWRRRRRRLGKFAKPGLDEFVL